MSCLWSRAYGSLASGDGEVIGLSGVGAPQDWALAGPYTARVSPKPPAAPPRADEADLRDASRGRRLQRVLADAGVASRRECERLIEEGRVKVNGRVVRDLPAWVDPDEDRIEVEGRPLRPPERHLYILLNKPPRTLTSAKDEPGADRRTVLDLVNHPARAKLFPVGRLDYDTTGLLILTNDGELANRLTHPRYGVPKTYRAVVKGNVDEAAMRELEAGVVLADRKDGKTVGASRTNPVEWTIVHREADKTTLDITIREGRNRQVRRMLAQIGHEVKKLERTAMGPLRLKGVARGGWRELTHREVEALRKAAAMGRRG
ncbi:MAG: rRNA pseudouridine synthase [Phycisphaeraceae bacterium]|nr:MAG: rRNA pseudouridine synthase [Phycisphaeraceae bacterium]